MATKFKLPQGGPAHISAEPQKAQAIDKTLQPGLEHRPFSEEEVKSAFDCFDLDKNRFVGAMEIRHILNCIGEEADDDEIDEMIRMCDNDGDGQVTFDEFHRMMTQPPPPLPPPLPEKIKAKRGGAAKRYQEQAAQAAAPGSQKPKKVNQQEMLAERGKHRAVSVETLVKKLSGGMEKIKPSQIKRIYKRFQDIDTDGSGAIEFDEFIVALDMEDSTIARQMFKVFDMDGSESIELKDFIVVLSRYTSASKTEKLKFAFMMFDEDGSGFIERDELIEMMQASFVVEGFSAEELEEKADMVFETLGLPPDGAISYEDFLKLAADKRALIYPIEEMAHTVKDASVGKLFQEVQGGAAAA